MNADTTTKAVTIANESQSITCQTGVINDILITNNQTTKQSTKTTIQIPAQTTAHITLIATASSSLHITLEGDTAIAHINTLAITQDNNKIELNCTLKANAVNTQANIEMEAITYDKSSITQKGKLQATKDATDSQLHLAQNAIITNLGSHITNTPQLEVHTQSTRASHSAQTTYLTKEDKYYLESKGVNKEEITRLTTASAIEKTLNNITSKENKEKAQKYVEEIQKTL